MADALALSKDRARRKRCAIPRSVRFRTRHELAPEMLEEAGPLLPHAWVAGDGEMGRSSRFRAELRRLGERHPLAVPSNATVRGLDAPAPTWGGRGRPPKRQFEQVRAWAGSLPPTAWRRIEVGDGERGPEVVELVEARVVARTDRGRIGPGELLVVIRRRNDAGVAEDDDHLPNAPTEVRPGALARVARAGHRVEERLQRGKSEAGPAGYQVRAGLASPLQAACRCDEPGRIARDRERWLTRTALARFYRGKKFKRLAPLRKRLLL